MLPFAGELPTTLTTIYTVPTGKKVEIRYIGVSNTGGVGADVDIYVGLNGHTVRVLTRKGLPGSDEAHVADPFVLIENMTLQGVASVEDVNFFLSGQEYGLSGN